MFGLNANPQPNKLICTYRGDNRLSPLWPPADPRSRIRIFPNGKARSSDITINWSPGSSRLCFASKQETACPLKFINVCGLTSFTALPSSSPRPTNELHSRRLTAIPASLTSLSINMKPRLCRDHSYSLPGLPSPTISRMTIADLRLPIVRYASACRRPADELFFDSHDKLKHIGQSQMYSCLLTRLLQDFI